MNPNGYKPFFKQLLLIDSVVIILAGIVHLFYADSGTLTGIVIAFLITSLNAGVGFYLIENYRNAAIADFMRFVIGGMMLRLGAMLLLFFLIVFLTPIPQITFTVSLFISYIYKSVLEIIFINKRSEKSLK